MHTLRVFFSIVIIYKYIIYIQAHHLRSVVGIYFIFFIFICVSMYDVRLLGKGE